MGDMITVNVTMCVALCVYAAFAGMTYIVCILYVCMYALCMCAWVLVQGMGRGQM